SVPPDGIVTAPLAGAAAPAELGQIQVASFANPAGLQAIGDNFLVETAASGAAQLAPGGELGRGSVRQGMLEASNVNIVEELVSMIECQRAYEISSKMVSAVDEMLRNANQTL
ncbi:MAG TPA: flagellar hook-basal body complex protein, partial [Croceibacterium sp.]